MATSKSQAELEVIIARINKFIAQWGYPHDFVNRVALSGKDQITIPLTREKCGKINPIIGRKLQELLAAGDYKTQGAICEAMIYLTREPERTIFHSIVEERARLLQQARLAAMHSGSMSAVASGAPAYVVSSPVVKFTPARSGVSLGDLPPSRRVEEHKEPVKVETFDATVLAKDVVVVNQLPGLKRRLSLEMSFEESRPILDFACDEGIRICESDSSDSGSDSDIDTDKLLDATTHLGDFFRAKKNGTARLVTPSRAVLAY